MSITKTPQNSMVQPEDKMEQADFFTIQAVFSLAANLLLLAVLAGVPKLRRPVNCLVGNLCVSSVLYTLTGCVRLAEGKKVIVLSSSRCYVWRMFQQMGTWVTASMLSSIGLLEYYQFSHHPYSQLWTPTFFSVLVRIILSWTAAISISSISLTKISYNSSALLNTTCIDALQLHYPPELLQNLLALIVFYIWGTCQLLNGLCKIRWNVRDLICGKFEGRYRGRCADDFQVKTSLKQLKYIVCYSMIYLLFWVPQGFIELFWALTDLLQQGISDTLYWIKSGYDGIRHPIVSLLPLIFVLLSCTAKDLQKLCFGSCFLMASPIDHHGVHSHEDSSMPTPSHLSNWNCHVTVNTNVELSNSQHSLEARSESHV